VQADFVEHAPEVNEPPDFDVRTAQTGNRRHEAQLETKPAKPTKR
jgi:hypothetical protein